MALAIPPGVNTVLAEDEYLARLGVSARTPRLRFVNRVNPPVSALFRVVPGFIWVVYLSIRQGASSGMMPPCRRSGLGMHRRGPNPDSGVGASGWRMES